MKLHQIDLAGVNLVHSFRSGKFNINNTQYKQSIIVSADNVIENWKPQYFNQLTIQDFELLASFDAEIVILGTGEKLRYPSSDLLEPLRKQKSGFEIMNTEAACRTYNILIGDGRNAIAALLQEPKH